MLKPYETRSASIGGKKSPGYCIRCSGIATTEALFKLEGIVVIQRYCDKCLPGAQY